MPSEKFNRKARRSPVGRRTHATPDRDFCGLTLAEIPASVSHRKASALKPEADQCNYEPN